ncbi:MAG: 50S ribosomal protein L6 [Desulfobacterales bacterium]|nr:50S ribosomal protein L6 [Desulfobacterales bacterium]
MSRVGKKPVQIPPKATVSYKDRTISVKGEKGTLSRSIHSSVDLKIEDSQITVIPLSNDKTCIALQGLTRSLVANLLTGVSTGFSRLLEINGIGYRAEVSGKQIVFNLGYSHPINFDLPDGISAEISKKNVITLTGIDKELLGHTAAAIRSLRPPEPYKGKGIKYAEERIQRKAGKTGTK